MELIKVLLSRFIDFTKTEIWRIRLGDLPRTKGFLIKQLRILLLVIRGFDEDKCRLRASALTFYSLLSVVPVAAMAFGIAKGFGFARLLEKEIMDKFSGQEEVVARIIDYAHTLLENTKGGVLAGIGVAILLWSVLKVLSHIESSFNEIWGIKENRPIGRKFTDYLSIMLVCPLLVIISSSATLFITTQVTSITQKVALLGTLSPLIFFFLRILPYCLIWILFTFMYIFMPNTKVSFTSGLVGGIIAGTLFEVAQWAYISFQVGVARYNAIYGSFAFLPLFVLWLQLSWMIILFGAEISFAHQNVETYEFEPDGSRISPRFKKLLSLQISHLLVKNFSKGIKPVTARQISQTLEIPIRLVNEILHDLVESRVFSDTLAGEDGELAYQPARDINGLTIQFVIKAMEEQGVDTIPIAQTEELKALSDALSAFEATIQKSPKNRLLKDI
ncbi:MAG: YihY family inner membrane protein [Proteobacteria bacterium]|nr:YihY family inner membrane protein [Pseudomonadota bacterium]